MNKKIRFSERLENPEIMPGATLLRRTFTGAFLERRTPVAKRQETFSGIPLPGGLHQALPGLLSGP